MVLSTAMRFVMMRAQNEAYNLDSDIVYPEHIFLSILKLAEMKATEITPSTLEQEETEREIDLINIIFEKEKINIKEARPLLRHVLKLSPPLGDGETLVKELLSKASDDADQDPIQVFHILILILKQPGDILCDVFNLEIPSLIPKSDLLESEDEMLLSPINFIRSGEFVSDRVKNADHNISQLASLANDVGVLRRTLAERVHGQDHVIHSIAEGLFNADALRCSENNRKRPKAIFVFMGPPGVGKTFLAEQTAQTLKLPFKRFDMSEYADDEAYNMLIGFAKTWKNSQPGELTTFVKGTPRCILLFDEIEKAHRTTTHLFLQILDAGLLRDCYYEENISFSEAIIIFTTNVGKSLYGNKRRQSTEIYTRSVLISALESEKKPNSDEPFFPPAICSRLGSGYVLMFNHLHAHDLEKIASNELKRLSSEFWEQYGVKVEFDSRLPLVLIYKEGGSADARMLRAQSESFFKTEIFQLCRLWEKSNFSAALKNLDCIRFVLETDKMQEEIKSLFEFSSKINLLIVGETSFAKNASKKLPSYHVFNASNTEQALALCAEHEIDLVLVEWIKKPIKGRNHNTIAAFDNIPIAASSLAESRNMIVKLRALQPELLIYLLETDNVHIDSDLMMAYMRCGASGKLKKPASNGYDVFSEELANLALQGHMRKMVARLADESKVLSFETAPILVSDKRESIVRLRNFSLKRVLNADVVNEVVGEGSKPEVGFENVIGAEAAKEELRFFVEFLKNPLQYLAQGLKAPKGVLLYGPPGTGKTMLAKATAGESGAAFFSTVSSAFVTKWQGSGPEAVRRLFEHARKYAPSIIFIDEIDAIGRTRESSENVGHGEEMTLNALLAEMDGFGTDPKRMVFVLAATNFSPEGKQGKFGILDAALTRRFDRTILVDLPNQDDRYLYLNMCIDKMTGHQVSKEMIDRIAVRSSGLSLASLEIVLALAVRTAIKKNVPIDDEILDEAFETSSYGEKKNWGAEYMTRIARHEAGHAYLSFLSGHTPAYISITARADHGGYMEYANDQPIYTKEELLAHVRTDLGGRAAEIVYYGDQDGITTGTSGDLETASSLVKKMICSYGMDELMGLAVISDKEANGVLTEKILNRTKEILEDCLTQAIKLIRDGRVKIDLLVDKLLEKNKLGKEEISALLL